MTNEELFGREYRPMRAMTAIDEADETVHVCRVCGETLGNTLCECCRESTPEEEVFAEMKRKADEDALRATVHTANTLKFIMDGIGVRL